MGFQSPSRKDRSIEMFLNVRNALIQNKCLVMPHVYIRPEVDKNIKEKVKSIIERHDGEITGKYLFSINRFTLEENDYCICIISLQITKRKLRIFFTQVLTP